MKSTRSGRVRAADAPGASKEETPLLCAAGEVISPPLIAKTSHEGRVHAAVAFAHRFDAARGIDVASCCTPHLDRARPVDARLAHRSGERARRLLAHEPTRFAVL